MKSNLGEYLYDLRKKSGKTIKVLKEELKISPQYLNDIENNKRIPSDKLLRSFAETYKLGVNEKTILFDLATENSKTKKKIPVDIANYILENEDAKSKIRKMIYEEKK